VTLARLTMVFGGGLLVMLVTIALRAEATRLQHEQVRAERETLLVREAIRDKQLELARLRNPALIQRRVLELHFGTDSATTSPTTPRNQR
jgi:hypothetical protein